MACSFSSCPVVYETRLSRHICVVLIASQRHGHGGNKHKINDPTFIYFQFNLCTLLMLQSFIYSLTDSIKILLNIDLENY